MAGAWPPSQNNGLGNDSRGSHLLQNIGFQLFIDCSSETVIMLRDKSILFTDPDVRTVRHVCKRFLTFQ